MHGGPTGAVHPTLRGRGPMPGGASAPAARRRTRSLAAAATVGKRPGVRTPNGAGQVSRA